MLLCSQLTSSNPPRPKLHCSHSLLCQQRKQLQFQPSSKAWTPTQPKLTCKPAFKVDNSRRRQRTTRCWTSGFNRPGKGSRGSAAQSRSQPAVPSLSLTMDAWRKSSATTRVLLQPKNPLSLGALSKSLNLLVLLHFRFWVPICSIDLANDHSDAKYTNHSNSLKDVSAWSFLVCICAKKLKTTWI